MATPTLSHAVVLNRVADGDSPNDPSVFTLGEIATILADSAAVSSITSQVTSAAASGALDSVPVSTADSKAVSAAARASVADSKAVSVSANTSVADSKAVSVSVNTSIADSKAVSATALIATAMTHGTSLVDVPHYPPVVGEVGIVDMTYPYGDVRRFGAVGDGVTDDWAAITNALTSIDGMGGGVVDMPAGTFGVTATVVVPNRVVLNGAGRDIGPGSNRGTIIYALAVFPVSSAVVQLGDGTAQAFGCRVQNLCIHCNAIAGSIGVFSAVAQESSGLDRVTIRGYMAIGVSFTDPSSALFSGNFVLSEVEILCDSTATATKGFYWLSKNSSFGLLHKVTINSKNTSVDQTAGIHVQNGGVGIGKGNLIVHGANIEGHFDGIIVGAETMCIAAGVGGFASQGAGSSLIKLEAGCRATLSGLYRNSTYTNTITDSVAGVTVTEQTVLQYTQGISVNQPPVVTLTDASTVVCNSSLSTAYAVTLGGNRTMGAPSNAKNGKRITLTIIQDGTGGRTLAWNAVFKQSWSNTGNTAGLRSTISFVFDGTNWNQDGAQTPYV